MDALALIVLLLGVRHGFDADHLAAIDGLTRISRRRACGMLFSLGHGAVVISIALAVSALAGRWQIPRWLEAFGAWTSILCLVLLGAVNFHSGFEARPLARWGAASPFSIFLIGAAFAVSFDTFSEAALFSATAGRLGGWVNALAMGLVFTIGMLITDGLNGLWIARLLRRAGKARFTGKVLALLSLLVAALGLAKLCSPEIAHWSEGKALTFGFALILAVALAFPVRIGAGRQG